MNALFHRMPRAALYAVAALLQIAAIAWMVMDRASILRNGAEVTLRTQPIDPRDLLRGDYVTLGYAISNVPTGELKGTTAEQRELPAYVKLARGDDGFHRAVSLHLVPVPVAAGEVLIRGRISNGLNCNTTGRAAFCPNVTVQYGLEKYFVPQGDGLEIESARNKDKVTVVAAVTPDGRAAIKRLLIDGKPVYDEPLY
jgi:uncharacterized membrane-anchored protein